jgi:hypothetical protein
MLSFHVHCIVCSNIKTEYLFDGEGVAGLLRLDSTDLGKDAGVYSSEHL